MTGGFVFFIILLVGAVVVCFFGYLLGLFLIWLGRHGVDTRAALDWLGWEDCVK